MKRLISIVLIALLIPTPVAHAKTCRTTHASYHSVYKHKTTYRWHTTCSN